MWTMHSFFSWQFFKNYLAIFFQKCNIMLNIPFFKNIHQKLEKIWNFAMFLHIGQASSQDIKGFWYINTFRASL
jgi:hypothetical protein